MSKFLSSVLKLRIMGCEHSRSASRDHVPDDHPTIFKGKSLNEKGKTVEVLTIEVKENQMTIRGRNRKIIAKWPISGIQKYGYSETRFMIETGDNCQGGKAIFLFKMDRAEDLFKILKRYYTEAEQRRAQLLMHNPALVGRLPLVETSHPNVMTNHRPPQMVHQMATTSQQMVHQTWQNSPHTSNTYVDGNEDHNYYNDDAIVRNMNGHQIPQPFNLQPAPQTRQEMVRRRTNLTSSSGGDVTVAYDPARQQVALLKNNLPTGVSPESNYQNVRYDCGTNRVDIVTSQQQPSDVIGCLIRKRSVKSDGGGPMCLTPSSNVTSGVGSMASGASTSLPARHNKNNHHCGDPWKYRHGFGGNHHHHRGSPMTSDSLSKMKAPHSAKDYVNTFGPYGGSGRSEKQVQTPRLPQTAFNFTHFNFDFAHGSAPMSRNNSSKLNYSLVDPGSSKIQTPASRIDTPGGVSSKVGRSTPLSGSSTSSGVPGTPKSCGAANNKSGQVDYAMIDHSKTQALSRAVHRTSIRKKKFSNSSSPQCQAQET